MSRISIIGTGTMAQALGARAVAGSHTVEVVGRDPAKALDLAESLGSRATTGTLGNHASNEVRPLTETPLTASGEPDHLSSINLVLSEVIDVGQDVKQARRKISEVNVLHTELVRLFKDLGRWARALAEEDEARGVSPLGRMPSVAGRKPRNLWADTPTDADIRHTLSEHLALLAREIEVALGEDPEEGIRAVLASVRADVVGHLTALRLGMSS